MIIQVDPARCTDCRLCEIYCSLQQEGYVNPSLARVQIRRDESRRLLAQIVCPPCGEKKCLAACPEPGALVISPQTGAVVVVEPRCTGCCKCIAACEIGAIRFLRQEGRGKNGKAVALKCDQCGGDPACTRVCEPKALEYVNEATGQQVFERLGALLAEIEKDWLRRGGQPRRRTPSR